MTVSSARPRILYVIASRGAGTGGHHFSLRDLSARMRAVADVQIVTVANQFPPALRDVPDVTYLPHAPWRMAQTMAALLRLCRTFRPTVIHSYDAFALQMARVLSVVLDIPLVHTQCGGPTARTNVPRAPDVIVFSEENLSGLSAHPRMAGCRLHHIASRVEPVAPDLDRIAALRAHLRLADGELVLMRVNRFVPAYEPVMRQTLTLAQTLRAAGLPVRAVLLGSPNEPEVVARIAALCAPGDTRVHDEVFTRRAAEVVALSDVVVGTGRGLMEAASLGRPLFASLAERTLPAPVAPDTVEALAGVNFSPRAVLPLDDKALAARAVEICADPQRRAAAGEYARHLYETRFDVGAAVPKHLAIYAQAQPWPRRQAAEAFSDLGLNVAHEIYARARLRLAAVR